MALHECNIYTPVKVGRLKEYLRGFDDARFVVDGFKNGFSLGLQNNPNVKGSTRIFPAKTSLCNKIQDEVEKGRVIGPVTTNIRGLMVSPVQVIPKQNSDKVRMIFNLSHPKGTSVNDNIQQQAISVSYCSVTDVVTWILNAKARDEWFMAKADLSDAYRMVPIRKSDWKYLGMQVGKDVFIDRCLPMGAASSCCTFQRISDALTWACISSCSVHCKVFNYLDDFLIIADGRANCEQALQHFEEMCDWLGVPLSAQKTVRATLSITFLGLGIDTKHRVLFVPPQKAAKTLELLLKFLGKTCPRVREWQSILGKLSHLTHVIPAGRVHLSSVYGSLKGILSQKGTVRRCIGKEARHDLGIWKCFLQDLPPTKCFRMIDNRITGTCIYTDSSSSIGFGAILGHSWIAGVWPNDEWRHQNITLLELYPIYAAITTWRHKLDNSVVTCYTDNGALVYIINKLYTKDGVIRRLLKLLVLWCLSHNVIIRAIHVPGVENTGPDLLSRDRIEEFKLKFPLMNQQPDKILDGYKPEDINMVDLTSRAK